MTDDAQKKAEDQRTKAEQDERRQADLKRKAAGDGNDDEIQFFDTTITKLVERKNEETGDTEWVEAMSDNLYPGEKLKREVDEEKAKDAAEKAQKAREKAEKDNK